MPVNIPVDKPVSQDLYAGSSEQQVDALTDLLMHFDTFAKKNLSLEAYLRQPAQPLRTVSATLRRSRFLVVRQWVSGRLVDNLAGNRPRFGRSPPAAAASASTSSPAPRA